MAQDLVISRFAPSPTGRLHLGHAYSAMLAHDLARAAGGRFFLQIEDIDVGRCRAEFVEGICEDLRWLGLEWDGEVLVQSRRMAVYAEALERLDAMGMIYRCWCTRAEIAAASASAPQGEEGPIYLGTCKGRSDPGDGRAYCWRLDVGGNDPVIARKDTPTSYHLSVVVDDAAQGVTDIVRGKDLESAVPVQTLLQNLLGLPTPRYRHHPLIGGADGERLAKRRNSPTLVILREGGADPKQVVAEMRRERFPFGFSLLGA